MPAVLRAEALAALRVEYADWLDSWEGTSDLLSDLEDAHRRYAGEVRARRDQLELEGAPSSEFVGWWGNSDYSTFSHRLETIGNQLQTVADRFGLEGQAVLVAPWPEQGLHARTARTERGYVVLVGAQSLPLLRTVAYTLAGAARRLFPAVAPWKPDPLDDSSSAAFLALCVKSALGEDLSYAVPPEEWAGARAALHDALSHAATEFMVAHEFAHICAGHLDDPQYRTLIDARFAGSSESSVLSNMRLEHDADLLAAEMLLEHWHGLVNERTVQVAIVGPLLLLGFQILVDHAGATLWNDWGETHPSALLRGSVLLRGLTERKQHDADVFAKRVFQWFYDQRDVVVVLNTGEANE